MSSLSSASATAGGTETVEGLLRRCSLNLKSFSNGLSDTKTAVLGLTDFHNIVKNPKTTPQAFNDGLLRLLQENWNGPWDPSFARIYHYGTGTGFAVRAIFGAGQDEPLLVVDADTRDELRQTLKCAMATPSDKAVLRIANWEALCKHSEKTADNTGAGGGGGQPKSEIEFKGVTINVNTSAVDLIPVAEAIHHDSDLDAAWQDLLAQRPTRTSDGEPYADTNAQTKSWKTTIIQKCATLLAKEPIYTFGSFPDFETDDSESMHTIFADVQRFDNVLQVLNDIDGYLISILCKLFTVAPQGTPVSEALSEFREHLRESNVASLQGRNPISLIKLGLLTNHGTCLLDLVQDKLRTFKTGTKQSVTEQAEIARDAISFWTLEDGKTLLQGLTALRQLFTSAEAHGIPIPDDATQCFRFKKGLEKGIYGKISTDVYKRRKDFFNYHHNGNWTDTLSEFVQLIQDDEDFAKLKPVQESTGDNDAGGKTDRKSRSQRRKEYRKKKAAETEEAALSNNTQTDQGQKSGTPCGICNRVGHSRDKCFYKNSVETMIKHCQLAESKGERKRGQMGAKTFRSMMEENEGWGAKSKRSASRSFLTSQLDELKSEIATLKQGVEQKDTKESEQSQEGDALAAGGTERALLTLVSAVKDVQDRLKDLE